MAKKLNIADMQPHIVLEPIAQNDMRYIRCRVLIVCEGEKTEPNYFRSFNMMKNSSGLVYEINCDGGGINTMQVVDKAIELKDKAERQGNPYDTVWSVFDRDSFKAADFDNAIAKAKSHGIGCAWSNEAFELWYVYHFDARCTAMSRTEYKNVITQRVIAAGYKSANTPYIYRMCYDAGTYTDTGTGRNTGRGCFARSGKYGSCGRSNGRGSGRRDHRA